MSQQQYRANLIAFHSKMHKYRSVISEDTIMKLTYSPFWNIIKVFMLEVLTENECRKSEEDITRMVRAYNVEEKGFVFGEKVRRISVEDVARCFGLRNDGIAYDFTKRQGKPEKNAFVDKFFSKSSKVTKLMVEEALEKSLKNPAKQNSTEVSCLIIMYLFITFLFCTSGYTMSWNLVTICTDLRHLRSYSWASMILDHLHLGLKKKTNDKVVALSGCLPLILYWLVDKIDIGGRIERHQTVTEPTFMFWSLIEVHKSLVKLTNSELEVMFERKGQKEEVPTVVAATLQEIKDTLEQIKGNNPDRAVEAEDQHMTEDEDINDEDFETPTFGDWRNTGTQELKKEGETAQRRMKEIINSLEETTTQQSLTQEESDKTQLLLKELTEENDKLQRKNEVYWELLEKTYKDYDVAARKTEILQRKLLKKWKRWTTVNDRVSRYERVVSKQLAHIHSLQVKVRKLENKLEENDMLDSDKELEKEEEDGNEDEEEEGSDKEVEGEAENDGDNEEHDNEREENDGKDEEQEGRERVEHYGGDEEDKGSEKEDSDEHDDHQKENKERAENENMRRKKTKTKRSSMVERVKRNKRKLLQDSCYMYGTPEGVASEGKGKKRQKKAVA